MEETEIEKDYLKKKAEIEKLKEIEEEEEARWRYMWNACSPEEALDLVAEDMMIKWEKEKEDIRNKKIWRPNAIWEEEELKRKARSELLDVAHHGVES